MIRRDFLKSILAAGTAAAVSALAGRAALAADGASAIPFVVVRRFLARGQLLNLTAWKTPGAPVFLPEACALLQRLDTDEYGVFTYPNVHQAVVAAVFDDAMPPADSDSLELRIWAARRSMVMRGIDPTHVESWHATEEAAIAAVGGAVAVWPQRAWRAHTPISGRLSPSEPNLQNIPIRTEEGTRIRAALRAWSVV